MKTLFIVLLTILSYWACADLAEIKYDRELTQLIKSGKSFDEAFKELRGTTTGKVKNLLTLDVGLGLFLPISGRCQDYMRGETPARQYFGCNRVQILISNLIF